MKTFCVDFETYYSKDFNIIDTGIYHYLRSEETDIYLLSVVGEDYEWVGHPKDFDWMILSGARVIAHNMAFDGDCINALREKGVIPTGLVFADESCTADMSVYLGGPRALKNAAFNFLNIKMSKDVRDKMKGKHVKDLSPEEKDALYKYASDDAKIAYQFWQEYSFGWPQHERDVSKLNREMGWRGVSVDVQLLEEQKNILTGFLFETEKLIPWSSEEDVPLLSPKRLRKYCLEQGIDLPKSVAEKNPEFIEWLKTYETKVEVIKHLRQWRKANILLQKLNVLESRIRPDGTFATELKYFGAVQTGRFSGQSKFNLQNLPRESWNGVDIRKLFIPREGRKFILADLAQIEARVLNWVAGNTEMLSKISEGWNLYEAFANSSGLYNGPKGTLKKADPKLYNMAKATVLGCGFGMSDKKFFTTAPVLTDKAYNPTMKEATVAVDTFRESNPKIVEYWVQQRENFLNQVRSKPTKPGVLETQDPYIVKLASGRNMTYWSPSANMEFRKEKNTDAPLLRTWYGMLTENIVQATARDLLTHFMLELNKKYVTFVFTVHDEIVCEVPEESVAEAEKIVTETMSTAPDWAPGLPLAVETKICERYEK